MTLERMFPDPPAGWAEDDDHWLVRPLRRAETIGFWRENPKWSSHGFCQGGRVFARSIEAAAAFDAAATE